MTESLENQNFIESWLREASINPQLMAEVIRAIAQNLSSPTNEDLNEDGLVDSLLSLALADTEDVHN